MQTKDAKYSAIFKKARPVTKEHKCIVNHMRVFQFEIIPNSNPAFISLCRKTYRYLQRCFQSSFDRCLSSDSNIEP